MLNKIRQVIQRKTVKESGAVSVNNTQLPMIKLTGKSFDDVLKMLITGNGPDNKKLTSKGERKKPVKETPSFNRPALVFDPETD